MVYETEFYRRPYSRPTLSSYTVTVSARIPFSGVIFFSLEKWWRKKRTVNILKLVLCVALSQRKSDSCEVEKICEWKRIFMKVTLTQMRCVNSFEKKNCELLKLKNFLLSWKFFTKKISLALLLLPETLTQTIHTRNLEPFIDGYNEEVWECLKATVEENFFRFRYFVEENKQKKWKIIIRNFLLSMSSVFFAKSEDFNTS